MTGPKHESALPIPISWKNTPLFPYPIQAVCCVGLCLWGGLPYSAMPQDTVRLRSSPYLPFNDPEPAQYNVKWKNLEMRLRASLQVEFNDNINVASTEPASDISFGPRLGFGFRWLQSRDYQTEFNLDLTYRWYLNNSELNTFGVAPSSEWRHKILIDQNTQMTVYDSFSIDFDPTTRADVSGSPGQILNFRRFTNTAGAQVYWQGYENLTLTGGYSFTIERTLSDDFTEVDRNIHGFSLGSYYQLSPRWTAGLVASYSMNRYVENVNNDSDSVSYGPVVTYKPSRFLLLQGSISYISYSVDQTGTISDTSESDGVNYELAVMHEANSRTKHSLRLRNAINAGFSSNTIETFSAQYNLDTRLGAALTFNSRFAFEDFTASGITGDSGNRYLFSFGFGARLTPNWSTGINYSLAIKNSDLPDRDYTQNRIILDFNRQF